MNITSNTASFKGILTDHQRLDSALNSIQKYIPLTRLSKMLGTKRSGHNPIDLLYISLFLLPLSGSRGSILSYFTRIQETQSQLQQALYRLLRNTNMDWRKFHLSANTAMRKIYRQAFGRQTPELKRLLIVDDTLLKKTGRKIQGCSKVHDHTDGVYKHGYKLLGLHYFNGFYSYFLDFSLHAEGAWQEAWGSLKQTLGCTTPAGKRSKELGCKKTDVLLEMIKRHRHYQVDYILADSWFCSLSFLKSLLEILPKGANILFHAKMDNTEYYYQGEGMNLKAMLRQCQTRRPKYCKDFNCYYYRRTVCRDGLILRVFFSRMGKNSKWVAFLTTDTDLSFIEMLRTYALRWKIETAFRDLKQHLNLSRCQANSFNAQIAHVTQALVLHAFLSHHVALSQILERSESFSERLSRNALMYELLDITGAYLYS